MTFKQIVCVLHFQKKQLPLLLHRVICKYIHTSWLCEQNAMDREVRYTAVSIRNSQYLPSHCSNVIRKTKMPLSTSHVFHPALPNFISIQISYSLLPFTSFSSGYSQVQDMHPTLLFHGIKESLHWMGPFSSPGFVLKLPHEHPQQIIHL